MKRFLWLFLLGSSVVWAAPKSETTTATVTQTWPQKPKGEIQFSVREAMNLARRDGNMDRATEVGERSDEALPFLDGYSRENNDDVRFAVLIIAQNSHSPRALQLLSNVLIRSNEASNATSHVLKSIARFYNRTELRHWGGPILQNRLMQLANRDENYAEAILILPTFADQKTRAFLRKLRFSSAKSPLTLDEFSPRVARAFAVDVALSELNDKAAFVRLKLEIEKKRTNERVWLCHALPFVQSRGVLRLVTPFLSDLRIAKQRSMFAMSTNGVCREEKLAPLRVCDVAARL